MSHLYKLCLIILFYPNICYSIKLHNNTTYQITQNLYGAESKDESDRYSELLLNSDSTVFELVKHFEKGPLYSKNIDTGRIKKSTKFNHLRYRYVIDVPDNYDYRQQYPVVFFLHGGVNRQKWRSIDNWWPDIKRLHNDSIIKIYPAGWHQSVWWSDSQVLNLLRILKRVKKNYNIDTNRVYISGLSDGGSGIYYIISRIAEIFAAAAPVIASPSVIANQQNNVYGNTFPVNLKALPWIIINGKNDTLYSPAHIEPYIKYLEYMGIKLEFILAETGHSFVTLIRNINLVYEFFKGNIRDPHPNDLIWEVESNSVFNRHYWIVVDEVSDKQDPTVYQGFLETGKNKAIVKALIDKNTISLSTISVAKMRVLIPSHKFDLSLPIIIYANKKPVFNGMVKPSKDVLLKWLQKDLDPQRLYISEIEIDIEIDIE